jgi:hypothetical protein
MEQHFPAAVTCHHRHMLHKTSDICFFSLLQFVTITGHNLPISAADNKALQFQTSVTNLIPTVRR